MRRIICITALSVVAAGISGITAVPASADSHQRSFQIQSVSVTPCPLQGTQCDPEAALVLIEVQAPKCVRTRNLQAVVDSDKGLAEVVGTLPAKCRTWTPTSITIKTSVSSDIAELLVVNYSG